MIDRARLSLEGLSVGDAFGEQLLHAGPVARQIALQHRAVASAAVFAGEREPRAILETVLGRTPPGATREGIRRSLTMLAAEPVTVAAVLGNGSRVLAADTVPFAIWCAATLLGDFAAACWSCVEVGGDIDTTCAMVGGIVAGAVGVAGIPAAWHAAREPLPV